MAALARLAAPATRSALAGASRMHGRAALPLLFAQSATASAAAAVSVSATPAALPSASALHQPRCGFSSKPPKKPTKLVGQDLTKALIDLPGWEKMMNRECIQKKFEFADFNEAWGIMSRVALLAEKMNHHPKWENVYGSLRVQLETHDVNGVSDFDIYMATQLETYVAATRKPNFAAAASSAASKK